MIKGFNVLFGMISNQSCSKRFTLCLFGVVQTAWSNRNEINVVFKQKSFERPLSESVYRFKHTQLTICKGSEYFSFFGQHWKFILNCNNYHRQIRLSLILLKLASLLFSLSCPFQRVNRLCEERRKQINGANWHSTLWNVLIKSEWSERDSNPLRTAKKGPEATHKSSFNKLKKLTKTWVLVCQFF